MSQLTDEQKQVLINAYLEFERKIEDRRRRVQTLLAEALKKLDQIKISKLLNDINDNNQ